MADRDAIERQLAEILDLLREKEEKFGQVGHRVAISVFIALFGAAVWNRLGNWPVSGEDWTMLALLAIAVSAVIATCVGGGVFWSGCISAERKARRSYIEAFATQDARKEADYVLRRILEAERSLQIFPRFRRKLGVVTRRFLCRTCGDRLKIQEEGRSGTCRRCNIDLRLTARPHCPGCGSGNTRLMSPQEQVAPIRTAEGKTAGALMYGPAGVLAGGLLDAIYKPFKEAFRMLRVVLKGYVYRCEDCCKHWAYSLPLAGDP